MHNTEDTLCGWTLIQIAYAKYSFSQKELEPTVSNVNLIKNMWRITSRIEAPTQDLYRIIPSVCYEWATECFCNATANIPTGARLDMKEELEAIIKSLAKKTVDNALKSEDVLRLTQSALNLAHTISVLRNI